VFLCCFVFEGERRDNFGVCYNNVAVRHAVAARLDVGFDVSHRVTDRTDRFLHIVWDFDIEFFFESHDQFDQVQGVSTEVVDEACALNYLVGVHVEIIDYDFFNTLKNVRHEYLSRYAR
jgi:hypothetical protein